MPFTVNDSIRFGSDETFRAMREAAGNDRDLLAKIILICVKKSVMHRVGLSGLGYLFREDVEDLVQDVFWKVYSKIDGFLADPQNQISIEESAESREIRRQAWLATVVRNEYLTQQYRNRRRTLRDVSIESITPGSKQEEEFNGASSAAFSGEENVILHESLEETFRRIAESPRELNTILIVLCAILSDVGAWKRSAKELAEHLNGKEPFEVLRELRDAFWRMGYSQSLLDPLEARVQREENPVPISKLSDAKIYNRRNAFIKSLRDSRGEESSPSDDD